MILPHKSQVYSFHYRPNAWKPVSIHHRGATAAWTARCPARRRGIGGHAVERLGRGDAGHAWCWSTLEATEAFGGAAMDGGGGDGVGWGWG